MLLPTRLSEDALAILRLFVQASSRKAGSSLSLPSIRESWRRPETGVEAGLAELAAHGLVETRDEGTPRAILTATGEAFFERFHRSCH